MRICRPVILLVSLMLMSCEEGAHKGGGQGVRPGVETVVMFGDSHIQYGNWEVAFPNYRIINYGIAGDPTEGLVIRTDRVVQLNPDKVFIEAGANDIYFGMAPAKTIANFRTILGQLKEEVPGARIHVLSIFPHGLPSPKNPLSSYPEIVELNTRIKDVCEELSITFIDLTSTLQSDDALAPSYDSGDGIHLSEAGYDKVVEVIEPYLRD